MQDLLWGKSRELFEQNVRACRNGNRRDASCVLRNSATEGQRLCGPTGGIHPYDSAAEYGQLFSADEGRRSAAPDDQGRANLGRKAGYYVLLAPRDALGSAGTKRRVDRNRRAGGRGLGEMGSSARLLLAA